METTDGKDKSVSSSIRRLARMMGTDSKIFNNEKHWSELANYFHEVQVIILTNAIENVLSKLPKKKHILVSAGAGHFLVEIIARRLNISCIQFSELFDCDIKFQHKSNVCASAVAIAQLNRLSKK